MRRSACVPDELPLGHLVFDVGAGQVDGQQDQTVAQHVHGVCREANVAVRAQLVPDRFCTAYYGYYI